VEPHYIGGVELRFAIRREYADALDLNVELVVSKALSGESYSEERTVRQPHAGAGETLLARSAEGYEFVLARWSRVAGADAGKR
jgi:hypothetical protein